MKDIAMVNRQRRIAVMEDGQILPVTNLYDVDGEETEDVTCAVSCVVGPDAAGFWYSVDLTAFEQVRMH